MLARSARMMILCAGLLGATAAHGDWHEGVTAFQKGDFIAAEADFADAVRSNPRYAGSHYMLGLCQERLGKTAEAVASLSKAVELAPENTQYIIGLARALNSDGQSARTFELMAAIDAGSVDPALRTAFALVFADAALRLDRAEDALPVLERRLAEDPSSPSLHRAAGTALDRLGRRAEAFAAYARACELDPSDAASCRAAINAVLASSDEDLSAQELEQMLAQSADLGAALARSSPTPEHFVLAGETSLRAGRYEAAASWFEKANAAGATDPLTLYYWGRSLALAGHRNAAVGKLDTALRSEPDDSLAAQVHVLLARIAECRLDLDAAAHHHRLAGNRGRAEEMEKLARDYGKAFERRRDLEKTIAGLKSTLPRLKDLGDEAGQEAINDKIADLGRELATIDADLAAVRGALERSCPDG